MLKQKDIRRVVNENIAKYMKRENLNNSQLCRKTGISENTWSRKFNCKDDTSFMLAELSLIAKALKVTVSDLTIDTDQDSYKELHYFIDALRCFVPAQ